MPTCSTKAVGAVMLSVCVAFHRRRLWREPSLPDALPAHPQRHVSLLIFRPTHVLTHTTNSAAQTRSIILPPHHQHKEADADHHDDLVDPPHGATQ